MFRYNPNAKYEPNKGQYLQILSGRDLYKQVIVISIKGNDTFPVSVPNIFVDYPLGQMRTTDKKWKNWNKALLRSWQTQLNFVVFCASSACRVSSEHLNCKKHSMVRVLYRFHMYYHARRILKRLRFLCHTKPVLTLLTILTLVKNSLRFGRIMELIL